MAVGLAFDEFNIYAGRTERGLFELYYWHKASATFKPLGIEAGDVVRFKLADDPGAAPILDIDSVDQNAASRCTIENVGVTDTTPAQGYVQFGQAETKAISDAWAAGTHEKRYSAELTLVDNSEINPNDAIKLCGRGFITLKDSPAGDVGLV